MKVPLVFEPLFVLTILKTMQKLQNAVQRRFFESRPCQRFAVTRQIFPPASSATSNDPFGFSITPTGRP